MGQTAGPAPSGPACVAESGGQREGMGTDAHGSPLSCLSSSSCSQDSQSAWETGFHRFLPFSLVQSDNFLTQFKPAGLISHPDSFSKILSKSAKEGDGDPEAWGVSGAPFSNSTS